MLKQLEQRRRDEEGFTLIELMVVVLIMGILMAIAIPTFLSTKGNAYDSSAKSNVTNVLTGEKAQYADSQAFVGANSTATGATLDNSLPWGTAKGQVQAIALYDTGTAVAAPTSSQTPNAVLIEDLSQSNNCFYVYDSEQDATTSILGYAETTAGCSSLSNVAFPESSTAIVTGKNAGANTTTGAAGIAATGWYSSW